GAIGLAGAARRADLIGDDGGVVAEAYAPLRVELGRAPGARARVHGGDFLVGMNSGHLRECKQAVAVHVGAVIVRTLQPEALLELKQVLFERHEPPFRLPSGQRRRSRHGFAQAATRVSRPREGLMNRIALAALAALTAGCTTIKDIVDDDAPDSTLAAINAARVRACPAGRTLENA